MSYEFSGRSQREMSKISKAQARAAEEESKLRAERERLHESKLRFAAAQPLKDLLGGLTIDSHNTMKAVEIVRIRRPAYHLLHPSAHSEMTPIYLRPLNGDYFLLVDRPRYCQRTGESLGFLRPTRSADNPLVIMTDGTVGEQADVIKVRRSDPFERLSEIDFVDSSESFTSRERLGVFEDTIVPIEDYFTVAGIESIYKDVAGWLGKAAVLETQTS